MKMKLWTVLEFIFLLSASGFFQCTDAQSTAVTTPDPTTALPVTNSKPPDTTPPPTQAPDSTTPEKTTEATPHPSCEDVDDWALCKEPKTSYCKGQSHCYCVNKEPFCRCDNYDGKFYIGDNCEQEWTILTFVLVATLPGVALATVVGVAVYLACNSKKKNPKGGKKSAEKMGNENGPASQTAYPNPVFASDFQGEKPQPLSPKVSQDRTPLAAQISNSYSYGQPSGSQSSYNNPYAKPQPTRNPYESIDRYGEYRRPAESSAGQNGMTRGGMSGYNPTSLSTPSFAAPDYNNFKPQFPRAQMGRPY